MNRDKPTAPGDAHDASRDEPDDHPMVAPDHDVPNEEVIEKTLPEPSHDKPLP
jgi:hypothetical protein